MTDTKKQLRSIPDSVDVTVSDIGGIDQCSVKLQRGVNILTGRNATNRTSFLRAVASCLGGDIAAAKSDTGQGEATLEIGDKSYNRELHNTDSGTHYTGKPYSTNKSLVELFVAILEDNPARIGVKRSGDLRDLIMRPIDMDEINRRINTLQQEKQELESERTRVQQQRRRLPQLEERQQNYSEEIEQIEAKISKLREEVSEFEADAKIAEEADQLVDKLESKRQELKRTENQIDVVTAEIDALEEELSTLQTEQERLTTYDRSALDDVQQELNQLRQQKRDIEEDISNISTIINLNEDVVENGSNVLSTNEESSSELLDELAPKEKRTVECWTCGSSVTYGDISDRLNSLRETIQRMRSEKAEVEADIEELREKEQTIKQSIDRQNDIEYQLETTGNKLDRKRNQLEEIKDQKEQLEERITELEREAAETEELRDNDLLDTYEQITDLEYRKGELSQQLDDVKSEIEKIEELPNKSTLDEQIEEVKQELKQERTRIESLEKEAVDKFNKHMTTILDILEYENIERVWIERLQGTSPSDDTTFEIHVIREDESGSVYEDQITNLSESEREIIGLTVALAGYQVHDVHTEIPFMLLDSLEAIDAHRIGKLVDYFSGFVPYLVVALLPEDASKVPDKYRRVPSDALQ